MVLTPCSPLPAEIGRRVGRRPQAGFTSGLAEIIFENGQTILQGPATLEVRSRSSAVLTRGKLSVTVEKPQARGFEVVSPGMKYTDLGTEFGVLVAENAATPNAVTFGPNPAAGAKLQLMGNSVTIAGLSTDPSIRARPSWKTAAPRMPS